MKKSILSGLLLLLAIAILINISSCAGKGKNGADDETESSTYKNPTYFSPLENTETKKVEQTESESETETEAETETVVKKPIIVEALQFTSFDNGTCYVSGIGNCSDTCIIIPERSPDGDIVTSIGERAFYGNKDIKAIQISSTVTSIGDMAFGGCTSLVYISVDAQNRAFCDIDGVLYSIDSSTLIMYPAACGASSIELPKALTKISNMAFYDCPKLTQIYYQGSLSDWGKINIGESNFALYTAALVCESSGK